MRCVVIGSGAFGFAIAVNLLKNGNDVTVWCSSKDKLNEIIKEKESCLDTKDFTINTLEVKVEDYLNSFTQFSQ